MGVTMAGPLELATFDGDVTLYVSTTPLVDPSTNKLRYEDGKSLEPDNPVIEKIICESPRYSLGFGLIK